MLQWKERTCSIENRDQPPCPGQFSLNNTWNFRFPPHPQIITWLRTLINTQALPNCLEPLCLKLGKALSEIERNATLNGKNTGWKRIKYIHPSVLPASHWFNDAKITLGTLWNYRHYIIRLCWKLQVYWKYLSKKESDSFQMSWAEELVCLYYKRKRRGRTLKISKKRI